MFGLTLKDAFTGNDSSVLWMLAPPLSIHFVEKTFFVEKTKSELSLLGSGKAIETGIINWKTK
jgi:hypothetical protein